MLVVRPSRLTDLEALFEMASSAAIGLTSLPRDRRMLEAYLEDSQRSFSRNVQKPRDERYLLVMEDVLSGKVVGCAAVIGRVGGFEPHYTYELSSELKSSESLGVSKTVETLHLTETHKGPSEIGTLFVRHDRRGGGGGRLMSLSRFLFMASNRERFAKLVIAEMRGVSDQYGASPFWDAIGRHFFELNFAEADFLSAADKQFIADLMPRYPIYVPMLAEEAQSCIGSVHAETKPALKLLQQEGFRFANAVDIFDAGPIYVTDTQAVRCIREAQRARFTGLIASTEGASQFLISNDQLDVRVGMGAVQEVAEGEIHLEQSVALALEIKLGAEILYVPARATDGIKEE